MKSFRELSVYTTLVYLMFFNSSCKNNDPAVVPLPIIEGFSPESGIAGDEITITGSNFDITPQNNIVKINSIEAEVISASLDQLIIIVPDNASTGKIEVTVGGQSTASSDNFTVSPLITGFSPDRGIPGDQITITGSSFDITPQNNIVKINNIEAEVISASLDQLIIIVPDNASTGKIEVTVGEHSTISSNDFTLLIDIPREGLVAFYPFKGNANDISGNDLHGEVVGTVPASDRYGNNDKAYSFESGDKYISMGNPEKLQISNEITIALWTKSASFTSRANLIAKGEYFLRTGKTAAGKEGYTVGIDNASGGLNFALLSQEYVSEQWTFIAFTLSGSNLVFYQDGAVISSLSNSRSLLDGSTGDFFVGPSFTGEIDDLAVYNRALDVEELDKLFSQEITKY